MIKRTIQWAAVSGFLAVALGAFGAHGLKSTLMANETIETFKTAVLYHFIHTLAILLALALIGEKSSRSIIFWFLGILMFSGSLYLLSLIKIPAIGIITPIGGLSFLIGWVLLFVAAKQPK